MANPAVTYTFSNGTTADATQVNQNFTDIINSLTDSTKSLTIDALTCAGAATFNGAVSLGNGSPDDITFTGSLASSIPIKTNNSFDIGAATLALGSVYLGSASSRSTRLRGHQSIASSFTLILPNSAGTDGYYLQTDGSGNTSWFTPGGPELAQNYSLTTSVGASAMTIALKDASGSDASSTSPVRIAFRSATAATGTVTQRSVTAALSVTITSGATLGHVNGADRYIYVYAIDNAGTVELAVSGEPLFSNGKRQSATALSSGSDSSDVLYATNNRTNVAIRFLGRIQSNQATAGTYLSNATEVASQTLLPAIITDWNNNLNLTFDNTGTVSSTNFWTRRVGDTLEVRGSFVSGATSASAFAINVPSGYTMDSSKMNSASTGQIVGYITKSSGSAQASTATGPWQLYYDGSTTDKIYYSNTPTNATFAKDASNTGWSSGNGLYFTFSVPISGWSATR